MPTDTAPAPTPAPKWWAHSLTVWGAIVTALSTVVPILGPLLGFTIPPDLIRQLGDNVVVFGQAACGLAGTLMTIYGRIRAEGPLQRRQIMLTM
jgi:hypothetical protein